MSGFCRRFFGIIFLAAALIASPAHAAGDPPMPEPLQNLVGEGAQMRYLGRQNGLDGWIAIKNGQEQYFYVTSDGQAFLMGLLFDKNGKVVTLRQVKELQEKNGVDLDLFATDTFNPQGKESLTSQPGLDQLADRTSREFKTPSEQLYSDIESANFITLGDPNAPYIYTFIDPQCPYCHKFINDMRADYIANGVIQVRMIPVGFRDETRAQAAFLLAVPNPQGRWYSHLDGDKEALPVTADINQQGVQRNLSIMQSWKVNVTPFTVYRAASGDVKIVQGRAENLAQIISDLKPVAR